MIQPTHFTVSTEWLSACGLEDEDGNLRGPTFRIVRDDGMFWIVDLGEAYEWYVPKHRGVDVVCEEAVYTVPAANDIPPLVLDYAAARCECRAASDRYQPGLSATFACLADGIYKSIPIANKAARNGRRRAMMIFARRLDISRVWQFRDAWDNGEGF